MSQQDEIHFETWYHDMCVSHVSPSSVHDQLYPKQLIELEAKFSQELPDSRHLSIHEPSGYDMDDNSRSKSGSVSLEDFHSSGRSNIASSSMSENAAAGVGSASRHLIMVSSARSDFSVDINTATRHDSIPENLIATPNTVLHMFSDAGVELSSQGIMDDGMNQFVGGFGDFSSPSSPSFTSPMSSQLSGFGSSSSITASSSSNSVSSMSGNAGGRQIRIRIPSTANDYRYTEAPGANDSPTPRAVKNLVKFY